MKYESPFSDYKPFQEQEIRPWKEVNQDVADSPTMGSMGMKGMHGTSMSGSQPNSGDAPRGKEGAAGHDMDSMKNMPGKPMPGMDKQAPTSRVSKQGAAGHDMGSMSDMPGKSTRRMEGQGATPKSSDGQDKLAMAKPHAEPAHHANTSVIIGSGVVREIDKANGKVKLTHDPIAEKGWPRMSMFFRLKDKSLADQLKAGDKVQFVLEKVALGYVISGFQKDAAISGTK